MLAKFLYSLYPYQIFKSIFFRGGMAYLTTFFLIVVFMPMVIHQFRKHGITSDFKKPAEKNSEGPYKGATPIMGGIILIPSIFLSTLLWVHLNEFIISLLLIMLSFAFIGALDDITKVFHRIRVEKGEEDRKSYTDKADGISGKWRITAEIVVCLAVVAGLYLFVDGVDGHLMIPLIPIKTWLPYLPRYIFIPFMVLVIVGGANAVNLTDGLDTLATVPILTCALFAAVAAYISGDMAWSSKLKILFVSTDLKEVTVFAIGIVGACLAFLKYNSPPASIYMGDLGSLGLGAAVSTMFIFVKAELYLPIVGGIFFIAAVSTIIQRTWFKVVQRKNGRGWAKKNRFFYRAPYHHHRQALLTYSPHPPPVFSLWHRWMKKLGLHDISNADKYSSKDYVNNKVIWSSHLMAVWLLVIALIIYIKIR